MSRIFISYHRSEEKFARRLATDLKRLGASVWLDVEDIPAGIKWDRAIQQALDTCEIMLVVVSPASMDSINVELEWQAYLDDRKPVIPVLLKPARMHFQLRRIQYIDFNEQEYNAAFQRLTTELQRYGIETAAFMPDGQGGSEQTEEGQPAAEPSPRGAIFQALSQFFTEDEWNPSEMENRPILAMSINGKNGAWRCYAQAREEQQQFVFYSVNQTNTPENKRSAVAEFITRANYGMIMGNFELDFRDGEVRYKTSIDVEGDEISQALIRNMVYANVTLFDRYLPGLMTVIYGGATPEEAIQSVEG